MNTLLWLLAKKFRNKYHFLITNYLFKFFFHKLGTNCMILKPLLITYPYITLGSNVFIRENARIEGIVKYNNIQYAPEIIINDHVSIQQNLHITCANSIFIGANTAIGANVSITDIHHPYTDIHIPIEKQDLEVSSVFIGEDCKIYNNAVILKGTKIGKHCTIGANSVVRGEFPEFSVIAGSPARVLKYYDFSKNEWIKTYEK